jgi:hypothetical protein
MDAVKRLMEPENPEWALDLFIYTIHAPLYARNT